MKKLIACAILLSLMTACRKDHINFSNADLKKVSLGQLKVFLNGKWRLQYSLLYDYAGYHRYNGDSSLFIFYPVDSIAWVDKTETVFTVRDKIIYTWIENSYDNYAYNLSFYDPGIGFFYNWTPDRTIDDTLVFVDNSVVGSSYFLTKEK